MCVCVCVLLSPTLSLGLLVGFTVDMRRFCLVLFSPFSSSSSLRLPLHLFVLLPLSFSHLSVFPFSICVKHSSSLSQPHTKAPTDTHTLSLCPFLKYIS